MAEQLLDQARDLVDGQIDFEGQKLAELLATIALSVVGAVSFLVGFFLQDIALALKIGLAGTAVTFVFIVPAWPFFKQHPIKWLPIGGGTSVASTHQNVMIDEKMFAQQ